ncbi:FAD-dependent oxidoreductase [uncultured Castellaniella sp.]|uniref:FAD-dependent oxidoreductase n=1 Tax=uncultured Castellaniella sp. TaxID=647907 RepID=UPI002602D185|nr:FAD-dependent oxidoreductase [uncultured Castellaniella sp.]
MSDWDVIVIGAGGAGLAAAVSAAEQGSRVAILESEKEIGGSTQLSAGMFTAAATSVQQALGVEDSPEQFFQHYMDLNQWRLRPGLIKRFCEASGPTLEWLIGLGVEFPAKFSTNAHDPGLMQAGVEAVWRGHVPKDQGYGLVSVLNQQRLQKGVDLFLDNRVEDLIVQDGRVRGIRMGGESIEASSVIVASGGFAHDSHLRRLYYPETLEAGEDLFIVAAAGSRGDHIRFGESANAALAGHGQGLLMVTSYIQRLHHWQSGFPPRSRIYVNQSGDRFMNEDIPYAVSPGIVRDNGGNVWNVFDEKARLALPEGYAHWNKERVAEDAAAGRMLMAQSLEELAAKMHVPPDRLAAAVARWNEQLPNGEDPDFLRQTSLRNKGDDRPLDAIEQAPFYAARTCPAELVCTHTGLAIDAEARVRDVRGAVIRGLYAAGEAGGGVLGNRYVGGGNSIANALTMGRIAGLSAALDTAAS